jgi:hypothetical protein
LTKRGHRFQSQVGVDLGRAQDLDENVNGFGGAEVGQRPRCFDSHRDVLRAVPEDGHQRSHRASLLDDSKSACGKRATDHAGSFEQGQ